MGIDLNRNIARFETLLSDTKREGMDGLLAYIRKSDFYTAPASTKYHLSCPGGLLQHSLNVYDTLRAVLTPDVKGFDSMMYAGGYVLSRVPRESVIITALLHDICKTHFYKQGSRNVKNDKTGKWEKVPIYIVDDKIPLGHGAKSVMILKQYINLTNQELYSIWHHMGPYGLTGTEYLTFEQAVKKYPLVWALHYADTLAAWCLEDTTETRNATFSGSSPAEDLQPEDEGLPFGPEDGGPAYEDAPPLPEEPEA